VPQLDLTRHLALAEREQQRHTLRRTERQVVAGEPVVPGPRLCEHLAGDRVPTAEEVDELLVADLARDAESVGVGAHPLPRCLAGVEVVVLDAAGDVLEVVRRSVATELADAQHPQAALMRVHIVLTPPCSHRVQVCAS